MGNSPPPAPVARRDVSSNDPEVPMRSRLGVGVAPVDATGLVTAVSPGEATVSAICNGGQASGSATITVS